jgi:RecA-family ATPase
MENYINAALQSTAYGLTPRLATIERGGQKLDCIEFDGEPKSWMAALFCERKRVMFIRDGISRGECCRDRRFFNPPVTEAADNVIELSERDPPDHGGNGNGEDLDGNGNDDDPVETHYLLTPIDADMANAKGRADRLAALVKGARDLAGPVRQGFIERDDALDHLIKQAENVGLIDVFEEARARDDEAREVAYANRRAIEEAIARNLDHVELPQPPQPEEPPPPGQEQPKPPPLCFINFSNWDKEPVPAQEWTVDNRIPNRLCVLFSGVGGTGKSTTNLHLVSAHVLGRDWLGTMPRPGPAIFIDAEDDGKVIHRRLAAITKHYNCTFADLSKGGLHLISLFGKDAILATFSRSGKVEQTPLFRQLLQAAGDIKPVMISIAASANVFAGSEIDRSQVQQFMSLLTRLPILANGSLSLIMHPSQSGIRGDTGESGSTQWHNSVRARSYMKTPKPEESEEGEPLDTDARELVFKKNNYGPISESILLRYQDGMFLPVQGTTTLDRMAQEQEAEHIFLDLLRRFTAQNRNASEKHGPSYAPAHFAKEEEAKRAGLKSKDLEAAMRRLFTADKIWNEPYGPPSRRNYRIAKR